MNIHNLISEVTSKDHPIAKAMLNTETVRVLVLAMNKGMELKAHKTDVPTQLLIMSGAARYDQEDIIKELNQYDIYDIPVNRMHSLHAIEDTVCLLVQSK